MSKELSTETWLTRDLRLLFGREMHTSWEHMLIPGAVERILIQLARELGATLARHGYQPEESSTVIVRREGIVSEQIGAQLYGRFVADPVGYIYELEEEVQKLRDKLARYEGRS